MLQCGASSFFARSEVTEILRVVRDFFMFLTVSLSNLTPLPPLSQGCQVRHAMWLPLHRVESPLLPFLPHESPVIPTSLSPRLVFRDLAALRRIRLLDVDTASTLAPPNRRSAHNYRHMEFFDFQPAGVWEHMDER